MFRPSDEVAERRHDPVGHFFGEKMPAILEFVQLEIRQCGLPPFEFLPSERNVLQTLEKERRLVGEGRAIVPDRAQPVARAHDESRQCCVGSARGRRRLRVAVMRHDLRRQDASIPHRLRHHCIHEHVAMLDQILADPARHQEAERLEMEVVADRPAPSVRDDEAPDAFRMPARKFQTDRPAPVVHEQGDVAKVEMIEQGGEPAGMTLRMMVLAPAAARRQAEADMIRRDAAELRAKRPDRMTEFERPGRVAVHEHDRLAFALVDEVHAVSRRGGEEPALERIHVVRHPVRTQGRRGSRSSRPQLLQFREAPDPALHVFVAGLVVREPGMRQGKARPAGRVRLELDGDQSLDVAALPAPCLHQTTVWQDVPIHAAGDPSPSVRPPHLDQKRPADRRLGDRAHHRGVAGRQPSTQHVRLGPRGVNRLDRRVDHAMERQVDAPIRGFRRWLALRHRDSSGLSVAVPTSASSASRRSVQKRSWNSSQARASSSAAGSIVIRRAGSTPIGALTP